MTTISWTRCSQILAELSSEERLGLKTVAGGKVRSLPAPVLEQLKSQHLVKFDGRTWVLTDDGRVVEFWC